VTVFSSLGLAIAPVSYPAIAQYSPALNLFEETADPLLENRDLLQSTQPNLGFVGNVAQFTEGTTLDTGTAGQLSETGMPDMSEKPADWACWACWG
jgi:hypothetical protein